MKAIYAICEVQGSWVGFIDFDKVIPLGPYSRTLPRAVWWSWGGAVS